MGILKRILGICETKPPVDSECWNYVDGRVEIDVGRAPELSTPGGAVRLEGRGLPDRVLIICGTDGQFQAFRNKCMHMGRRIDPLPDTSKIRCCSVSKATYDYTGKVVSGPAKGPLKTYRVEAEKGKVTVFLD